MNGCIYCTKDNECELWTDDKHKSFCDSDCKDKHPSNADKFRNMTDEELADELLDYFAAFYSVEWSREELLEWLKQEAEI